MGRPREPYEVRVAKGDLSNGPIEECVDRVPGDLTPPEWLRDEGLGCWMHVSEILRLRGQLSRDSYWSLAGLCSCWQEWLELREDIALNGRVTKVLSTAGQRAKGRKRGDDSVRFAGDEIDDEVCFQQKIRPEVQLFSDADRRLRGWLTEFGLTDSTRGKISKENGPQVPHGQEPRKKEEKKAPSHSDYGLQ